MWFLRWCPQWLLVQGYYKQKSYSFYGWLNWHAQCQQQAWNFNRYNFMWTLHGPLCRNRQTGSMAPLWHYIYVERAMIGACWKGPKNVETAVQTLLLRYLTLCWLFERATLCEQLNFVLCGFFRLTVAFSIMFKITFLHQQLPFQIF